MNIVHRKPFAGFLAFGILSALSVGTGLAQASKNFFDGRQMTIVVGPPAGGGYDLFGRMIARYMGKYLPGGNATFIVRNQPGAAGLVAANSIYNVAEKD